MGIKISNEELNQIPYNLLPIHVRGKICHLHNIQPVIYSTDTRSPGYFNVTDIICRGQCDNSDNSDCQLKDVTAV